MRTLFIIFSIAILSLIISLGIFWPIVFWSLIVVLPLVALGIYDMNQSKKTIPRNFPVIGRLRYVAEMLRPGVFQYFIESDIDGRPFSRLNRSVVYQRSKNVKDTIPFGTQLDVYKEGYEWVNHSIVAIDHHELEPNPKVRVGGPDCTQPYDLSLLNISAMSFGSLSKAAIQSLNGGAKIGGFAHNTGEGGISPHHLQFEGDLIFQVGTGYFGARDKNVTDPVFCAEMFRENACKVSVKMIELKLSQGAKPGHGGILPAVKNTPEIAAIRGVPEGKSVLSPPRHTAFSTPIEMMDFIAQLRELSGGKPIGFKLCIGQKSEFLSICKAMVQTGIKPDFIAIDGGEGGTGAAPPEFSNSVGMPLRDGLAFAYDALVGFDLKKDITLLCAGKVATGFDIFRAIAIGADACYSARAFMLSLGCIQSLECNKNICPTGIATQKDHLIKGLVVSAKKQRVANFQRETVEAFTELLGAAGMRSPKQINRAHVNRNETQTLIRRFDESYPYLPKGCLLQGDVPEAWRVVMKESSAETFQRIFKNPE